MPRRYRRIQTSDTSINKVQDSIDECVNYFNLNIFNEAVFLKDVTVNTTPTEISHGLNREPLGFLVVNRTSNVGIWKSPTPSVAPTKILMLEASSDSIVSLIVF